MVQALAFHAMCRWAVPVSDFDVDLVKKSLSLHDRPLITTSVAN